MNVMRFNEPFEEAVPAFTKQFEMKSAWPLLAGSPLIEHAFKDNEPLYKLDDYLKSAEDPNSILLPFNKMRAQIRMVFSKEHTPAPTLLPEDPVVPISYVIAANDDAWLIFYYYWLSPKLLRFMESINHKPYSDVPPGCTGIAIMTRANLETVEFAYYNDKNKRWGEIEIASGETKPGLAKIVTIFAALAADMLLPTNRLARVSPNQPGRSVEWVKARTHYTLVTHDHPANQKTVAMGQRVKLDPNEEITRMAHARRAHFKTLRHERYRFRRGQQVFVRATWVGPKEWMDEGGRQVYKILEPVE